MRVADQVKTVLLSGNLCDGGFTVEGISEANRAHVQKWGNEEFLPDGSMEQYRVEIGSPEDRKFVIGWSNREKDAEDIPFRWSGGQSKLRLMVKPNSAYDLTFACDVPQQALENIEAPGLYHDGELIAPLGAGHNELTARLASSDSDVMVLEVRCGGWVPGENDRRTLGIQGRFIEMKAVDSPAP